MLRTKENFDGLLYAVGFDNEPGCTITGTGKKEIRMVVSEGTCGMVTSGSGSYRYKVSVGMRFHPMVDTVADDSLVVECAVDGTPKSISAPQDNSVGQLTAKFASSRVKCHYRMQPLTGQQCELLDAEVGAVVNHGRCRTDALHTLYFRVDVQRPHPRPVDVRPQLRRRLGRRQHDAAVAVGRTRVDSSAA